MDSTLSQRFASLLARPDGQIPLDEAALVIAAHAQPGLDIDAELAALDDLASQVRDPTLTGVLRLLFRDLGFDGNREDYYDPRNSFLNEVLRRRTGIPITLSVLTIEVARRVSVPLWGVGMPGHFLLRDKVDPDLFIDPFGGGRTLNARQCEQLFRRIHGPRARLDPAFLEPTPRADIVARMLENLRGIYVRRGDRASLTWVLELRTALPRAGAAELTAFAEGLAANGDVLRAATVHERVAAMLERTGGDARGARRRADQLRALCN
ncbi:MAG TPA: transglutaminase-like domain-containing protein [Acidimicrobiales bacterium]